MLITIFGGERLFLSFLGSRKGTNQRAFSYHYTVAPKFEKNSVMFIKQFPEGVYVRDKKNIKQFCFQYDITCIIHTTNTYYKLQYFSFCEALCHVCTDMPRKNRKVTISWEHCKIKLRPTTM